MLCTKEDQLKKQLAAGCRAYLFYGSENYLIERYARGLTKRFDSGGAGVFNLQRFDGKKPDLDEIWSAVEALPLMAQEKCVVIDDLDTAKLPAGDLKKLEHILSDIPEGCTVLITAKAPGFDSHSANGKKLIAMADKAGCAALLNARTGADLSAFVKGLAKKRGCTISAEAARYLPEACGADMGVLSNEMDKLCAYIGHNGEIQKAHIDAVVTAKTEARAFDLSKALLAGNIQHALEILDSLFYLREQAVAILGALNMAFVDLYRARVARDSGKTPADVAALFGYKGREFRVSNAFSACSRFSANTLRRILSTLYDCDRKLKSTSADSRVILEQTTVQIYALLYAPQ